MKGQIRQLRARARARERENENETYDGGGARAETWNGFWRRKSQKAFNVIPPSVVLFGITPMNNAGETPRAMIVVGNYWRIDLARAAVGLARCAIIFEMRTAGRYLVYLPRFARTAIPRSR